MYLEKKVQMLGMICQKKNYFQKEQSAKNVDVLTSKKKPILWMYGLILGQHIKVF